LLSIKRLAVCADAGIAYDHRPLHAGLSTWGVPLMADL
jgi:hypothetical protein